MQKFDYLTPQERLAMIRPRLADAERRIFNIEIDSIALPEDVTNPQLLSAKNQLEALRLIETEIEAEIEASSSSGS